MKTNELYRAIAARDGAEAMVTEALHGRQELSKVLHTACKELEFGGPVGGITKARMAQMIAEERVKIEALTAVLGIKDQITEARARYLERLEQRYGDRP